MPDLRSSANFFIVPTPYNLLAAPDILQDLQMHATQAERHERLRENLVFQAYSSLQTINPQLRKCPVWSFHTHSEGLRACP